MGKTSAAVKNRYNEKAYDRISLTVPKGQKETIKAHAESKGESLNGFIQRAIQSTMETKEGQWIRQDNDGDIICTACGVEACGDESVYHLGNYCPNCGAKMKKDK